MKAGRPESASGRGGIIPGGAIFPRRPVERLRFAAQLQPVAQGRPWPWPCGPCQHRARIHLNQMSASLSAIFNLDRMRPPHAATASYHAHGPRGVAEAGRPQRGVGG